MTHMLACLPAPCLPACPLAPREDTRFSFVDTEVLGGMDDDDDHYVGDGEDGGAAGAANEAGGAKKGKPGACRVWRSGMVATAGTGDCCGCQVWREALGGSAGPAGAAADGRAARAAQGEARLLPRARPRRRHASGRPRRPREA